MRLDVVGGFVSVTTPVDDVQTYRLDLSSLATATSDLATANERIQLLESGGRWAASVAVTPLSAPYALTLEVGRLHRLSLENLSTSDEATITLPAASADNVGRRIGLSIINGLAIGPSDIILSITTTASQVLEGRTLPFAPAGYRPRFVFVAVPIVADISWGWSLVSYTIDSAP
jgi:hypothetical protein